MIIWLHWDWSTAVHSNCSWTDVARPCFLLRTDPASENLGITSLSAVVQWVSWRAMTNTLFFQASCSMTLILLAMSPSMFSCSVLVLRPSSAAGSHFEKGVSLPSLRRAHPARVAMIPLVSTDLVSISEIPQQGGPLERTCHLSQCKLLDNNVCYCYKR